MSFGKQPVEYDYNWNMCVQTTHNSVHCCVQLRLQPSSTRTGHEIYEKILNQTSDSFGAVELERILLLLLRWHYGPQRTFASLMDFSRYSVVWLLFPVFNFARINIWNCIMTNVMHKFLIYLSIYFWLTCFGLTFSPSSEAGVQLRQWFKSPGCGVSTLALTPYPGALCLYRQAVCTSNGISHTGS
jgi:hypothetical protein